LGGKENKILKFHLMMLVSRFEVTDPKNGTFFWLEGTLLKRREFLSKNSKSKKELGGGGKIQF